MVRLHLLSSTENSFSLLTLLSTGYSKDNILRNDADYRRQISGDNIGFKLIGIAC